MEGASAQLQRNQQALQELTRLISRSDDSFEETVAEVLELGCRYLDLEIGFLAAIDAEQDRFDVQYAKGNHPKIQPDSQAPLSDTYCRRTIETDGVFAVNDALSEGWGGDPAKERFDLACYLGGTVTVEDERYGTLCFADRTGRERAFSEAEQTFVELIVEWIAETIERHDQAEALAIEREFVDTVFDTLGDTVFVLDTEGRLKRWNAEVNALTGYDDEELAGMDARELFAADAGATLAEKIAEVIETGAATLEDELITADGGRVHVEVRASSLTEPDGTVVGICGIGRDVSERREREQRLRQYERAFENVRGLVYVLDEEGHLTLATPRLADRLGTDRETLVGTHVSAIVGDAAIAMGTTEHADETVAETVLLTTDGHSIPVQIEVTPLDDGSGVVGTIRDVSELAAARQQLDNERNRFQYLFDTIPDPVSEVRFVDGEPIIQSVNEAFEEVFGQPAAALVDRSSNDIIVPPDAGRNARAVDERVLRQGATTVEIQREAAEGLRDFLFRGIPYSDDGEHVEAFGIYTDITDQKRRERYLKILARIVRHNLRNKLDVILGNAQWLAEITDGDDRKRAQMIVDAATELASLSDTAQQIERLLEQGTTPTSVVDAATVIEQVAKGATREFSEATIETDSPESLPVRADERLGIALRELVDNAVEHHTPPDQATGDGGDESTPTVAVTAEPGEEDSWARITVEDDGPGIPETERWVLTGEAEITQLNHSRGLGLWLVKWIVESFGGDLDITASDDGSVVTIRLKYDGD